MYRRYRLVVPVRVEAVQVTPESYTWAAKWCRGVENLTMSQEGGRYQYTVSVPTMNGVRTATLGDYIIKNSAGDFSVMESPAFIAKYRPELPEEENQ